MEEIELDMHQLAEILTEISTKLDKLDSIDRKLDDLATGDDITKLRKDLLEGFVRVWEHTEMTPKLTRED